MRRWVALLIALGTLDPAPTPAASSSSPPEVANGLA